MEDLKTRVWNAYAAYLQRDWASGFPDNGWFEASKANDEVMRNEEPDLVKAFSLAKQAALKHPMWKELYWIFFQLFVKEGDEVKFRRPHAAAATTGGIIQSMSTHGHGDGYVSIRLENTVCVNSSILNLDHELS